MRTCSLSLYVNLLAFICIGLIASTLLTKAMPLKDSLPKTSKDSTPTELEMQLTTKTIADGEKRPNKHDNESGEESTTTSDTATVSIRRGSESSANKRFIHQLLPSPSVAIPVIVSPPSQEEIDDLMSSSKGMLSLSELAELQEGSFLHNTSTNDVRSRSLGEKTCQEMERKLNHTAPTEGSVYCPWRYKCDYDEQRYPRYLIQAVCLSDYCHNGCNNTGSSGEHGSLQGHCIPISVKVKILKPKIIGSYGSGSVIEWRKHNKRIRLGCKCSSQY